MKGYKLTKVWIVDEKLVVADTITKAIELIKEYYKDSPYYEPSSIRGISNGGNLSIDYQAIIAE